MQTPVLLADCFSGVRIGEERWNVLWEGSYWRTGSIFRVAIFCQEYFLTFFTFAVRASPFYARFSPVLTGRFPRSQEFSTISCVLSRLPPHGLWCAPASSLSAGSAHFFPDCPERVPRDLLFAPLHPRELRRIGARTPQPICHRLSLPSLLLWRSANCLSPFLSSVSHPSALLIPPVTVQHSISRIPCIILRSGPPPCYPAPC